VPLELFERPTLEGLDDVRVGGIGQHHVAPLVEHLGLLEILDLDFAADVLGALSPLQLNDPDPELLDCILESTERGILNIGLDHDLAVPVALPLAEQVDSPLQLRGAHNPAVLDLGLRVHAADVLAHGQDYARDGGAAGQTFPVDRGHIGRAHAADGNRQLDLDALVMPELLFENHVREDRLVRTGLDTMRADRGSENREVRIVNRVVLLFSDAAVMMPNGCG